MQRTERPPFEKEKETFLQENEEVSGTIIKEGKRKKGRKIFKEGAKVSKRNREDKERLKTIARKITPRSSWGGGERGEKSNRPLL